MTTLQNYCRMRQLFKNLKDIAEYDSTSETTLECDSSLTVLRNVTVI